MKELLKRITVNPDVMAGLPCVRGMRIPATTILGLLAAGAAEREILTDYPDLEADDIKACLAYAAWLTRERDVELQPARQSSLMSACLWETDSTGRARARC